MLKIFNTMTRRKETFTPLEPGVVKMYSCGPTVYNYFHLGNARPFVIFDLLRRYLEFSGYKVTFVQNFTDVDDKMIRRAAEEGRSLQSLADEFIAEYYRDADGLGIRRATIQPRATESMDAILAEVQKLLDRGHAYVSEDGVYFSTRSFPDYGKLSHFHLDELEAGASERVEDTAQKRDPADFALWKFRKEGEPSWPAPWGEGRPGWHIECSSMIHRFLGDTIDIHCGGQDLIFPHHENEIAQSVCATGKPFARYWMHNGFIAIDGVKISKSLGNAKTLREMTQYFPYAVLRYFLLTGQYRSPINFDADLLEAAAHALERIRNCHRTASLYAEQGAEAGAGAEAQTEALRTQGQTFLEAFRAAMDDDLNTPDALAAIFSFVRILNTAVAEGAPGAAVAEALRTLETVCDILGIAYEAEEEAIPAEVLQWLAERTEAKQARAFAQADALRDRIQAAGYRVMDTPQGARLEKL